MLDTIKNRRTIRKFKQDKISKEMIQNILKGGLLAPSSKNKKPVEFIVVEERVTLLKLKCCKNKGNIGFETASCAIVVVADSQKSDVWIEDASIAASYMQLQAQALGFGSVWIQVRKRQNEFDISDSIVKEALNVPDNFSVLCILLLGYKDENRNPYEESDIDYTKVHYEIYK